MTTLENMGPAAAWRGFLEEGRLRVQRCAECNEAVFEPRIFCPHCGSEDLGWIDCAGTGEVYALTIVSRKPDHGGNYGVALIDLDEGARVMARPRDLEGLKIGDRVTIEVEEHPGGGHWLRTVRVGDAQ
jgi:uncharacterized OB-fold protein